VHKVSYSIRRIVPGELPTARELDGTPRPMTTEELLNAGIQHLEGELYSCVDQYRRDPDTLAWSAEGPESPGEVITEGPLRDRHARLPADVRAQVLRAQVIRSADPEAPARALVETTLVEVAAALAEYVGDVAGAPLVDLAGPAAVLEEAQRLVEIPDNGIERTVVPMATVDAGDVVEADGLIPHTWQGESHR
jgi:hypothetical protein